MNFKKIINYILGCTIVVSIGCKKFVEEGNVNVNPNKPSFVTLNTLLPAVQDAVANSQELVAYTTSMFCQQTASYTSGPSDDDRNRDVRMGTAYLSLYQNSLNNSKILIDLANEKGSPYYSAIGKIMFVMAMTMATDTYGDVPLTDAFQAPAILQPHYDKQQDIYTFMQSYLDQAIVETGKPNPATLTPGVDDLIYGGSMTNWRQLAYLLKARLYMHTTKKGTVDAANNALSALNNAFTVSSKDCQLVYSDRNNNPWFKAVAGRIIGKVFTIAPSKRFVEALNGTAYSGLVDPRISKLLFKQATAASYTGIPNGFGNSGNTADITDATFYAQKNSPLLFASYGEQKLIEAEARFLISGSTQAAYDAYMAGIAANMLKLGIDTSAGAGKAYLTNPLVAVGAAGLTMELIMREKQVVLFLNPEAWVDVRRYDYDPSLFKGMAVPQNQEPAMNGQFIRRSGLPLDEINRNPKAKVADKPLTEKVWWDQ